MTVWTAPLTNEIINLISELQGIDPNYVFCGINVMLSDKVTGCAMSWPFESGALTVTPHDFRRTI